MKIKLAIIMALTMCLSLTACGDSGTAEGEEAQAIVDQLIGNAQEVVDNSLPAGATVDPGIDNVAVDTAGDPATVTKPETTQPAVERPEGGELCWTVEGGDTTYNVYYYNTDDAQVYACISSVDSASGQDIWNFVTEPEYVGQLDNYTIVGPTTAGFVFVKEDVVYCLNPVDGSLEWKSEPMGNWPAGYYAIDDYCNFYFPGYFTVSLTVVDAGGAIVYKYDQVNDIYGEPIDDGWCEGIKLGSDGNVRMMYCYEYSNTYVIDPEDGSCVDMYPTSLSMAPEMLVGNWMNNYYSDSPNFIMTVNEDLSFTMTTYNDDNSILHCYNGHIEIGTFVEDVGDDWLVFKLDSSDDSMFADWGGIGDYVCSYYYEDPSGGEYASMSLTQVNNGDSVLNYYFNLFNVMLYRFPAMG